MNNPASSEFNASRNSLIGHLVELRTRLLWAFGAMILGTTLCFIFVEQIYNFMVQPLANAMGPDDTNRLIYTGLTEAFFAYLKVACFSGVFITFPVILIQIWAFMAPGLYKTEKKAFLPFLIATPLLFFTGGIFVYYIVLPAAWPFFLSFQSTGPDAALPIQLEARVSEYLDLIMTLIFAFGLAFQIPVILTLLGYVGIISADWLAKHRKYYLILAFLVAAFITPPDIMSQFMLAIPLLALYELSIILIRLSSKNAATKIISSDRAD